MAEQMKKIECPAPCNFSVKSHDEKEIVEMTMQHAKKIHNMSITEQDVKKNDQAGLRARAGTFVQGLKKCRVHPPLPTFLSSR